MQVSGVKFLRASVQSVLIKVGGALAAFVSTVLLARTLGPAEFGRYSIALAFVSIAAIPAQAGIPVLVVREVGRAMALGLPGLARGVVRWGAQCATWLSLIVALLTFVGYLLVEGKISGTLAAALGLLPILCLISVFGGGLRGAGYFVSGQVPDALIRPSALCALLAVFWLGGHSVDSMSAMAMHSVAAGLALIVSLLLFARFATKANLSAADPQYEKNSWLRSLVPLALMSGLFVVNTEIDTLILGVFRESAEVGVYRAAAKLAAFALFVQQALALVVAPIFAKSYASGDFVSLRRTAIQAARASFLSALVVLALLVPFGKFGLRMAYGPSYDSGVAPLLILAVAGVINAGAGSVGHLLNMTGNERAALYCAGGAVVVNIVLSLLLAPHMGMLGVALATAISLVFLNVTMSATIKKKLGFSISVLARVN